MNAKIFWLLNNLSGKNIWLDRLIVFLAAYSGYVLLAVLVYIWFFRKENGGRWIVFLSLLSAAISRGLITTLIRLFYHHPRPFLVFSDARTLLSESGYSFPSGHASFYFAISIVVYYFNKKLGSVFLATSLLMGIARVCAGVHWPVDIVGGAILGIAVGFLVCKIRPTKNISI